jgi:hypothetical protein
MDPQTERQMDTLTKRQEDSWADKQKGRWTHRLMHRQTFEHTHTAGQTNIKTGLPRTNNLAYVAIRRFQRIFL